MEELFQNRAIKSSAEDAEDAFQESSNKVAKILSELSTLLNMYRSD